MEKTPLFETVVDVRRRRLREWIDVHHDGKQAAFLDACGAKGYLLSQSILSGLLKSKSFGEKMARALESGAGLPPMHLDRANDLISLDIANAANGLVVGTFDESPEGVWSPWPFKTVWPAQYAKLSIAQKAELEELILFKIEKASKDPPVEQPAPANTGFTGTHN